MQIEIERGELSKKDYKRAIAFAIKGMHFDWYLQSRLSLQAYGRYFWYLELSRATQIFVAYVNGEFAGVLLAEIEGERRLHQVWREQLYVRLAAMIQRVFSGGGVGLYEETVRAQREHFLQSNRPDGEILFLAVDPDCNGKGVGSALVHALEEREQGKTLYLLTDDACTYQFYEHRGFQRMEEQDIVMDLPKGKVPLKCMLYSKTVAPSL